MDKTVRLGTIEVGKRHKVNVFCRIIYDEKRLSITGVEGPLKSGECRGSCGQINEKLWPCIHPAPEWTRLMIIEFLRIWKRWHLNDMRAGCKHQTEAGWNPCPGHYDPSKMETCSSPKLPASPEDVNRAMEDVKRTGVGMVRGRGMYYRCSEDKLGKPCSVCGYSYGSAWLFEEVPAKVLRFLEGLPDTDITPAWV